MPHESDRDGDAPHDDVPRRAPSRQHVRFRLSACAALGTVLFLVGPPASSAAPRASAPVSGTVVVFAVPDLRWEDVTQYGTPRLWSLAERGSVGLLAVKAARSTTRCLEGWLTLSAGNRAASAPLRVKPEPAPCDAKVPSPRARDPLRDLRRLNASLKFGARPGALGGALHSGGFRTAAVGGPGARLAAADPRGEVDLVTDDVATALKEASLVVVEAPDLYGLEPAGGRVYSAASVDRRLEQVLVALRPEDTVLVVGMSDNESGPAHLHVAIAAGRTFPSGLLRSASTGRTPYVQLIDVAPSVLSLLGRTQPITMAGRPWFRAGPRHGPLADAVRGFVDVGHAARAGIRQARRFTLLLVGLQAALYVVAAGLLSRRRSPRWVLSSASFAAFTVAALPTSSFLIQAFPWWRHRATFDPGVLLIAVLTACGATWALRRRGVWAGIGVSAGSSAVLLALDLATGAHLQSSSAFGDSPLVAGRFAGAGNIDFALLATTSLLAATAAAALIRRPGRSRSALAAAAAAGLIGFTAVFLDGAPSLGDDFGGVLALGPATALLVLLLLRRSLSWRWLLPIASAGLAPAAGFALYNYSLPPERQTHIGRFVGQVLHGGATTVVLRKASTNVTQLGSNLFAWSLAAAVLALVFLALPSGRGHRSPLARLLSTAPDLRAGLVAVAAAGLFGAALNDSGIAIAGVAASVTAPLLVALCVHVVAAPGPARPPSRPSAPGMADPAPDPEGTATPAASTKRPRAGNNT